MHVSKITLRNFKSFPHAQVQLSHGFNCIVGPNGGGKCLTGDARVLLADGQLKTMRELVEPALASGEVTQLDDGTLTLQNPTGASVFSLNPQNGKVEVRPIQAFVKRTSTEKLIEIITQSGKTVTATPCHPVMTVENGEIVALPAEKLRPGILVATSRSNVAPLRNLMLSSTRGKVVSSTESVALAWDKIASVREVPAQEWVYDLCVAENHNFLAEGMFVHNSNVIDSLLFAFGESSLRAMRVKKTSDLIYQDNRVAEVTLTLEEGGKGAHHVERMVKRDGKTKYVLDGKRTKKYALQNFLSHHSLSLMNIIKQGEVQRIVEMTPKERRTLIDTVANVAEYEDKKKEAFSELDRVEEKLKEAAAILGEREGYLKELSRERDSALRYQTLVKERDSLKATLLSIDALQLETEFENLVNSKLDAENKLSAVRTKIKELESTILSKNAEKDDINRRILARGSGEGSTLQREIDALTLSIENAKTQLEEKKTERATIAEKLRTKKLELQRATDEVDGAKKQMTELAREVDALTKMLGEKTKDYESQLARSNAFSSQFHEARAFMETARDQMLSLKERLSALQADASKNEELASMKEREITRLKEGEVREDAGGQKALSQQKSAATTALKNANQEVNALFDRERSLNTQLPELEELLLKSREKVAELNAKLRANESAQVSRALESVLELKEKIGGVHGTVEELCSYSSKFAVPVQVGFGPRAQFVVVDSSKTASKAIAVLKERKLGRVSFIPLDKIRSTPISPSDRSLAEDSKGSMGFLIDHIEFDKRFTKAFEFVAGNTVIISDLKAAEPLIGKIRITTMEGELAEGSGLISGGSFTPKVNLAAERRELESWTAKAADATEEKQKIIESLAGLREESAAARKRKAEAELQLKTIEIELAHLSQEQAEEQEKHANLAATFSELNKEARALRSQVEDANEQRSTLIRELSELNTRALEAKQKMDVEKEATFGMQLKEREHALSELRVQLADYESRLKAASTQYSVYDRTATALGKEVDELKKEDSAVDAALSSHSRLITEGRDVLAKKVEEQKKISGQLADLINSREKLEGDVLKFGNEKGRLEFEREKHERLLAEGNVSRAVLETQLVGLKAQLQELAGAEILSGKKPEDKPELLALSKKVLGELESMGSVNLRAIELFEQRTREFEEQKTRVSQLMTEKEAVISMINEIEGKKTATFMSVFEAVNENFKRIFSQIFPGDGHLHLENPEKPFEGGLTIGVKLTSKQIKYLEIMSGGEKSLVALIFIFALQSVNPSSVYILDEADAALDAENSRKLAELLRALSKDTQFIVVSHNQNLYKEADALVGVAMAGGGSKIVEVKLNAPGAEQSQPAKATA